jgi:hypothetical protein
MVPSRREHKGIDLASENHVQELSQVRFLIRLGVLIVDKILQELKEQVTLTKQKRI